MIFSDGVLKFESSDMYFVQKFGLEKAVEMVLDYRTLNKTPFVYDTSQLAQLLQIRRKLLFHLCRNTENYYKSVSIKKRDGSARKLCVPDSLLKNVQREILKKIVSKLSVSKYATAYHKGRMLVDNASPHCGKKYLLKMDLKDFFDNITFMKVYNCVFNTFRYPKQIGVMLTQLCTKDDVLPQGAPTSPAISNLVMKSFDDTFGGWCQRHNLSYTRYCDDITVSGDTALYNVYLKAKSMLNKMGFEVNERKTHFVKNSDSQSVTGLTVNECVKVNPQYKKALRQELYYALKYSAVSSMQRSSMFEFAENESDETMVLRYINMLIGKTSYVLQIEPNNKYFDTALAKLHQLKNDVALDIKRSEYFTFN